MMNKYEAVVILNVNMSTEETKEEIKKYTNIIQAWCDTKKVKVKDMGIKKLAYPIKEIHTEGYYLIFTFLAYPENIPELERQFRIDGQVIKFITVRIHDTTDEEYELEDYNPGEAKSEQKKDRPNALDILMPDIHLTNDEKYNIIIRGGE